jgi:iron(III) transport system permease protein
MGLALVYFGAHYGGTFYRNGLILLPLLVFAYVVRFLPQAVGSTRAAFTQVSGSLPEAARTLGRSPGEAFRDVTLPLVAPGIAAGAALVFLTTMKELPATLLLRPAGFDTLVTRVWTAYGSGHVGQAAVPAFVLLFVSAVSMLIILKTEEYDVE